LGIINEHHRRRYGDIRKKTDSAAHSKEYGSEANELLTDIKGHGIKGRIQDITREKECDTCDE
jgi:hypothetical protein